MHMNGILGCVLLLCLLCAYCKPVRQNLSKSSISLRFDKKASAFLDKQYWFLFIGLLIVGIGVRIYRFPEIPMGVHRDGTMATVDAYALAKYGTDRFGTPYPVMLWGWGHGQQSALFSYFASLFVRFLGPSRLSMRLPMLVISLAALPIVWDWTRRMWGKNAALMTLGLLCVTPWHIMQSRWSIDAHMFSHMILFSCYFLYLGIQIKPFLYLSMFFFGLTMYSYAISFYSIPILLVASGLYLTINRKIKWSEFFICAVIYVLVSLPIVLTMAINLFDLNTVKFGPFTLQRFSESNLMSDVLFFTEKPFQEQMQININSFLENTFFPVKIGIPYAIDGYSLFYLFTLPLYLLAIPFFWRKRRSAQLLQGLYEPLDPTGGYILISWFFSMVICCLLTNETTVWRANGIYYPMILMVGYLLYDIIRRMKILVIPTLACFAIGFLFFMSVYFSPSVIQKGAEAFLAGQFDAIEYVKQLPYEHLYISTGDTDESDFKTIAEVKVLLSHQIDAKEYMGEKQIEDQKGQVKGYYDDIYEYWTADDGDFWADPEENAAYILWEWDMDQFDPNEFFIKRFDRWAVAYPQQMMPKEL